MGVTLETRVSTLGEALAKRVARLVDAVPGAPRGPVGLARALGVDKVLASRVLRAAASKDPLAVVRLMPGPEPLRRLASAAGKKGVAGDLVSQLQLAVDQFDELIRTEAGDRSAFDAIIAGWLPEARAEFELRRKQSIFRSLSQLRGQATATYLSSAIMYPSADGLHIDIVWIFALLGLQRLRPGSALKFATRRVGGEKAPRRPRTLDGQEVEGLDGLRLDQYCSKPTPPLVVQRVGDVVHYTLPPETGFGPSSAIDLAFAEVNPAEIARYVPAEQRRKRYAFAEVNVPSELLVFDVLVHEDLFAAGAAEGAMPSLMIYDTSFDGIANVNDPARDVDRMDTVETVQPLGRGIGKFRTGEVPWYSELLRSACEKLPGCDAEKLRGFRTRIDYPLYGSQVAMAFDTVPPPAIPGP